MKANVIAIGNSKGVRIPKVMLEECRIEEQVEIEREDDRIIIKPIKSHPRAGWDRAFGLMRQRTEDKLLLGEIEEDTEGWEWK